MDFHLSSLLGVELSDDLSWSTHIDHVTSKANKMLGLLRRNLYHCNTKTKDIAYKALIRPKLEYCSAIWDPHQKINQDKLEKVQNRAARFVMQDYKRDSSVTQMLNKLKWETLKNRRTKSRLITMYKETHGLIPSNIASNLQTLDCRKHHRTRQTGVLKYNLITTNKDCFRHSLYPKSIPEWNLLDLSIRNAPSLSSFKNKLDVLDMTKIVTTAHFKI